MARVRQANESFCGAGERQSGAAERCRPEHARAGLTLARGVAIGVLCVSALGVVSSDAWAQMSPSVPTNLRTEVSGRTVKLLWDEPSDSGSAAIYRYEIKNWRQGHQEPTVWRILLAPARSVTYRHMSTGRYHFKVRARNKDAPAGPAATLARDLNINHSPRGKPTISGTPEQGAVLTADISAIRDSDGMPARGLENAYRYQWLRPSDNPDGCDRFFGKNENTVRITDGAIVAGGVKVAVCFLDLNGTWEVVESDVFSLPAAGQDTTAPTLVTDSSRTHVDEYGRINLQFSEWLNPGYYYPNLLIGSDDPAGPLLRNTCDARYLPPPGAFTVTVNGSRTVPVSGVSVEGCQNWPSHPVQHEKRPFRDHPQGKVQLRFRGGNPIRKGNQVTVAYTDPTPGDDERGALQDWANNDAASFAVEVPNRSRIEFDPSAGPMPASAEASNNNLLIYFREALDENADIPPDRFTVTADGSPLTVSSPLVDFETVYLRVSPDFRQGQTVRVGYTDPNPDTDDTNVIQDLEGNDAESFSLEATNDARSTLSVADATVVEAAGATADFVVTLSPAAAETVTVDYATSDGTATAGSDYMDTSGTLTFNAGETTKTVSVTVFDDSHEDSGETFTLTLSNTSAQIEDPTAIGTITNDDPAAAALTAEFKKVPDEHEVSAFTFGLRFSEDVEGLSYRTVRDGFTASGGTVRKAERKPPDQNQEWRIEVEPAGHGAVTVTLPAGAVETSDGRQLESAVSATIAGPAAISVADARADEAAGAVLAFAVTLSRAASGTVTVDYATSDGSAQSGVDYTAADRTLTFRPGESSQTVEVEVLDDSHHEDEETFSLTLSSASGARLDDATATGTIIDDDPAKALTAEFKKVPDEHEVSAFTFGLRFSEDVEGLSYRTVRDGFTASGGTVRNAERKPPGQNQDWRIEVEPDGHGAVTVTLPAGAVETSDGRQLESAVSATIAGPVGISVADVRVDEAAGAVLAFAVTLSRAASGTVTVDYATADGSAQAGVDYTAASSTLTFEAGESSRTVEVAVLDDSHDEGEETLTLSLSNASGGRVTDDEATGTIVNSDPLPRALLARFGRTAAVHVVEHVEERMAAPRAPGFEGRFAGRELRPGMEREMALDLLGQLAGSTGAGFGSALSGSPVAGRAAPGTPGLMPGGAPPGGAAGSRGMAGRMGGPGTLGAGAGAMDAMAGPAGGLFHGGLPSMGLGGDNLLTGSAFALNRETGHGGILSFWSRGAQSSFYGREGALGLNGDVRTTMFGADYATGPMVMGLSLAHSRGLGGYDGMAAGRVASSVTGLYPWLGYQVSDRVSVWGVSGYGAGGMLLTPEGGSVLESDLSMKMAAAGTRGELVAGGADGFGLAFKADALWVGTAVEGVDGPAGRMAPTAAAVSRLRTALESSRGFTLSGRLSLTPSVEVGLRHDGGDAEQGSGVDVGGGLVVSDARTGLAVDLRVRMLLVHEAEGFRERGMALSLSYNPTPQTPLGLTARVAPSWGGQATSGAEALWGRQTMGGMAHGSFANGNRLDADLGYGLPVGSRLVGTPRVGFATSEYGRDYRLGYSLGALGGEGTQFELGVDAQRQESPMLGGASNGVLGRASVGW